MTTTEAGPAQGAIVGSYDAYGCEINAISPEDLFERYREAGFLYPAKLELLTPYRDLILGNWRSALELDDQIYRIVTFSGAEDDVWASVSAWRSTSGGWIAQHLVSLGSPLASRAVMLSEQAVSLRQGLVSSWQNWFRPTNRFPARVFGSIVNSLGPELSSVTPLACIWLPRIWREDPPEIVVDEHRSGRVAELSLLAARARGIAYAAAEDLDRDDLSLQSLDDLYARVGLRRFRRIWLARLRGTDDLAGAALVYRGPLGLNLSLLENRCDLLVNPDLEPPGAAAVACRLVARVLGAYDDFPLPQIPAATDAQTAALLVDAGCRPMRPYVQSVWLQDGFAGWYQHVDAFYGRIARVRHRRGLGVTRRQGSTPSAPVSRTS